MDNLDIVTYTDPGVPFNGWISALAGDGIHTHIVDWELVAMRRGTAAR